LVELRQAGCFYHQVAGILGHETSSRDRANQPKWADYMLLSRAVQIKAYWTAFVGSLNYLSIVVQAARLHGYFLQCAGEPPALRVTS